MIRAALPSLLLVLGGPAPHPAPGPVSLVVVIVVDQMRGDYLDRFAPQLTGGLARLTRGGAVFSDAYQDHAMAETAPGHATVLSGRNPASTGIVRNEEGVPDSSAPLLEVPGPGASPRRLRGTELFDWMQARWRNARALSVSRKDRGAILPLGHARQPAFWYQGGQYTTSTYYMDSLPPWVGAFNLEARAAWGRQREWRPLLPDSAYHEPDSMDYENRGRDFVFPHVAPEPASWTWFVGTPFLDSVDLALALRGVQAMDLGRGDHPDLLTISLSSTDYVGHAFGPDSREIHDQILRLDRSLGAFLDSLFALRDSTRIIVALTADHGVTSQPEAWNRRGDTHAQWVNFGGLIRQTQAALVARLGPGAWVRYFNLGLLVMDRPRLTARGVNVDSIVRGLAEEMARSPAVERVDTRASLASRDTATDVIARRWRNLVPPDLGAELMVTLKPHMSWGVPGNAEHGQPSDDDTHVPLLLWGDGVRAGRYGGRVSVVDLAPTLARILGIRPLERVQGRVLAEALRR